MSSSSAVKAHRKAVTADLQTMASTLVEVLGRPITAYIVHVRNVKTVSRWATGEVNQIRDRYSEERLVAAYQMVSLLLEEEVPPPVIKQLTMGMNPALNDESPAQAIREGDYRGAMSAARNYIAGAF